MPEQDEEDVTRYGDNYAPGVVAPPSNIVQQQAAPITLPGSSDSVIAAAAGQLNAGQPVTALPRQSWSFPEQQAFNARLDAFDQQAKAARVARDQAARDAQMLDQMMRVARSTKDIEVAMQTQDQIGFRSAVAAGTPALQALQRFPRAATPSLVSAIQHATPPPAPTIGTVSGVGSYLVDAAGKPHFVPGSEPQMPITPPQDIGGGVKVVRVSPQHLQVLDTGKPQKLPIDVAQEVAWRNADIKAAQTQRANLLKAGTRANAPDIVKLDQAIEEQKNAVRALEKPAGKGEAPAPAAGGLPTPRTKQDRDALPTGTRYVGPDGRIYRKK